MLYIGEGANSYLKSMELLLGGDNENRHGNGITSFLANVTLCDPLGDGLGLEVGDGLEPDGNEGEKLQSAFLSNGYKLIRYRKTAVDTFNVRLMQPVFTGILLVRFASKP